MCGAIFGKPKKKKIEILPIDYVILNIKSNMNSLKRKQKYAEKRIEKEVELAKQNYRTDKKKALEAIKRKKIYENQIEKLDGLLFNLEEFLLSIDQANINVQVMNSMKEGTKALKEINNSIKDPEKLMEEVREQMDIANEISGMIGNVNDDIFDDDELYDELDKLTNEPYIDQLNEIEVPTNTLNIEHKEKTKTNSQKKQAIAA